MTQFAERRTASRRMTHNTNFDLIPTAGLYITDDKARSKAWYTSKCGLDL